MAKKTLALSLFCAVCLLGCILIPLNGALAGKNEIVLRHGDLISPRNASYQAMMAWSDCVERKSKGRIKIEHFWSGSLGGQRQITSGLMAGTIDLNYSGLAVIAAFDPRFELGSLPFLYETPKDYEDLVVHGWIGELQKKYLLENGLRILSFAFPGWTHYYTVKPIKKATDLRGMKLRIQESPMYMHYLRGLGVIPTPIPWADIYTGLQTRTFDGLYGGLDWSMSYGHHEAVQYVTPINNNFLDTAWMISEKTWQEKLSPEDREILEECSKCYFHTERSATLMSELLRKEQLSALNINTDPLPSAEMAKLKKMSVEIMEPYIKKVWGDEIWQRLYDEIYSNYVK